MMGKRLVRVQYLYNRSFSGIRFSQGCEEPGTHEYLSLYAFESLGGS